VPDHALRSGHSFATIAPYFVASIAWSAHAYRQAGVPTRHLDLLKNWLQVCGLTLAIWSYRRTILANGFGAGRTGGGISVQLPVSRAGAKALQHIATGHLLDPAAALHAHDESNVAITLVAWSA